MQVKELIALLKKLPADAEVVMSRDSEGNGFSPLASYDQGTIRSVEYNIENFYSDSHTDSDCCLEPGERKNFVKAICLWPMN